MQSPIYTVFTKFSPFMMNGSDSSLRSGKSIDFGVRFKLKLVSKLLLKKKSRIV